MAKNGKNGTRSATVKATKDARPKRPKVDQGEEFEQLVRQMFKARVDSWCKECLDEMPDKESRGIMVDNLTASCTSALDTNVDAMTDLYLSTASDDDDDDDDGDDGEDADAGDDDESGEGDVVDAEYEESA